jgi:hypothetical protein
MARLRLTKIASMTGELDRIAGELESIDPRLALALDMVSDKIEKFSASNHSQIGISPDQPSQRGSKIIDPKTLTDSDIRNLKVQVNVKTADILSDRMITAIMVEAGLKDEFKKFFEKGKAAWVKAWSEIKDKSLQIAIKSLNSINKIKEFIAMHPELKYAVIAAIILGYLAFPEQSFAEIFDAPSINDMAKNDLSWQFIDTDGIKLLNISTSPSFGDNLILKSLADHGPSTPKPEVIKDIYENINNLIIEKAKLSGLDYNGSAFKELSKGTVDHIFKKITPSLYRFGL